MATTRHQSVFLLFCLPLALCTSSIVLGDVRISSYSSNLVRVEPRGPRGFENRPTFSAPGQTAFTSPPALRKIDASRVATDAYTVTLAAVPPAPSCAVPAQQTDVASAKRSAKHARGAHVPNVSACCALCGDDPSCTAWVFGDHVGFGPNCWPLADFDHLVDGIDDRMFGCGPHVGCKLHQPAFTIHSPTGSLLYNSTLASAPNRLHWPSPLSVAATGLMDFPRFVVPPWGPAPLPLNASVSPELVATHGYDFRNKCAVVHRLLWH